MGLTKKQLAFCRHYAQHGNATEAARAAGYAEGSERTRGAELVANSNIIEKVDEIRKLANIDDESQDNKTITTFNKNLREVEEMKTLAMNGKKFSSFSRLLDIQNKMLGYYERHNEQKRGNITIVEREYDGSSATDNSNPHPEAS